jgi:hypothetical protein
LVVLKVRRPDFRRQWDSISTWMPAGAQPEGIDNSKLEQLSKHITWLLTAPVKPSFLGIQAGAFPLQLFCETESGPLQLLLAFPENDVDRERAVRGFFTEHGVEPISDHITARPGWIVIKYALPCVPSPAVGLLTALLRNAYGVSECFPLHFLFGRHPGGVW